MERYVMTCDENCYFHNICAENEGINVAVEDDLKCACKNYKNKDRVIELPCRVGDEVWFIKAAFSLYAEPKVEKISKIEIYDTDILFRARTRVFNNTALGKTVFLTREEAERALKEAAKND